MAWVVRNYRGVVIIHSRRAFSNIRSLDEARFATCLWAVESMTSLHFNKIIFSGDFKELFLAVEKPHNWLALRYQTGELIRTLATMEEYRFRWVSVEKNKGADFNAQSVTRRQRYHSYVANGHPEWLFEFFVNESMAL